MDEVENYVLRTGTVLEDGKDGGHGATYVGSVQRHRHVDGAIEAEVVFVLIGVLQVVGDGGAVWGIVKLGGFSENCGIGGGDGEEEEEEEEGGGHGGGEIEEFGNGKREIGSGNLNESMRVKMETEGGDP